jgi:protocatechuate 3,4-dioxygenase beta subunit
LDTATSDSGGDYVFAGLGNGEYEIWPLWSGDRDPNYRIATISGADLLDVDFELDDYAGFSGQVLDNSAQPVAGILMQVSGDDGSSGQFFTDAEGNFADAGSNLDLSPGDSFTITPTNSGYSFDPVSYTDTMIVGGVHGIAFTATSLATYTVSGRIADGTDAGIEGVTVAMTGQSSTVTDSNGEYSFGGVPDGSYTVTPSGPVDPEFQVVEVNGGDVLDVDFLYQDIPTYIVSGRIADSGDSGIEGISVAMTGQVDVLTDSNGVFTFTGIVDGAYTVTPSGPVVPAFRDIIVSGTDYPNVDFLYDSSTTYSVSGRITNASGNGVNNKEVKVMSLDGLTTFGSDFTDANGDYVVTGIANGDYRVKPFNGNYTPAHRDITVSGADQTDKDFIYTGLPPP